MPACNDRLLRPLPAVESRDLGWIGCMWRDAPGEPFQRTDVDRMPKRIVESPRPVSESGLWDRLVDFYRQCGPDAWRSGKVPQRITSNGYLADLYASVTAAFLRDWSRGGGSETPLILEVGGGSGLFAWLFLNRLTRHQPSGEAIPDFDYLLTDAAASNVQAWREIPRLRQLVDAGIIDLGVLKIGGKFAVETSSTRDWTELELTGRPVVLLANYVLDSVPCDLIRIRDRRIFQELIALESADRQDEDGDDFQGLKPRFESQEILPPYTENAVVNEVLDGYRDLLHEACIPVPLATIAFLETFLQSEFPFLMLAGDLAYTTPHFEPEAPLIVNDYVACTVNFHMLGQIFERWGGSTRFAQHADSRFSVGAFIKPSRTVDVLLTREAANHGLYHFTPHDAYNIQTALQDHSGELDFPTVCAWLRLARFDAYSARRCMPHLMRIVEDGDPFDRKTLRESLLEVYRCELPESEEESLDTHIAFLFMKAKMYQETVQLLTMSMLEMRRSAERLYLLAVAVNRLGRKEEASRLLFEILEGDPSYWTAMRDADGTPSELVEWLLAAGEDDLHLDHMVLRASVAAFSRLDAPKQPA